MSKCGTLPSFGIDLMWLTLSVGDMSVGRQEAFEIFRRDYYNNPTIEENKHNLKQRYAEAKSLGEGVNKSRQRISKSLQNSASIITLQMSLPEQDLPRRFCSDPRITSTCGWPDFYASVCVFKTQCAIHVHWSIEVIGTVCKKIKIQMIIWGVISTCTL